MIAGQVTVALEPAVQLVLLDISGQQHLLDAVIDTGFGGCLAMPSARIAPLGWPWLRRSQGVFADGSTAAIHVYQGTILWEGKPRLFDVHALDGGSLIGLRLIQGNELSIEVLTGGAVTVQPLSTP